MNHGSETDLGVLVVIPARYDSSRFPGKALADLEGRPLIVRTALNAARMKRADRIIVATDDERIVAAAAEAGCESELTDSHATGTDRIGEIASRHPANVILNLQGDEPLLDPALADDLVEMMLRDETIDIGTCAHPFVSTDDWRNPNAVKVVVDRAGFALYFSRAAIPGSFPGGKDRGSECALRHVGIYAFRRRALDRFLALEATALENAEGLEQLRALEHGMRIRVMKIEQAAVGVDTPQDLDEVRRIWRNREDS